MHTHTYTHTHTYMYTHTAEAAGVISWKSDLSSEEDLSGVAAMDTGAGLADWTKEPGADTSPVPKSPGSSWADFTRFPADASTEGDE